MAALRDVSTSQLAQCESQLNELHAKRAKHVVGENERVIMGRGLLEHGDLEGFGKLMFESHDSSRQFFENSCRELDVLVSAAANLSGVYGARLSGGGFGGSAIIMVKQGHEESVITGLQAAFAAETGNQCGAQMVLASDGAAVLSR